MNRQPARVTTSLDSYMQVMALSGVGALELHHHVLDPNAADFTYLRPIE